MITINACPSEKTVSVMPSAEEVDTSGVGSSKPGIRNLPYNIIEREHHLGGAGVFVLSGVILGSNTNLYIIQGYLWVALLYRDSLASLCACLEVLWVRISSS